MEKLVTTSALDPGHYAYLQYRIVVESVSNGVQIKIDKNGDGSFEVNYIDTDSTAISRLATGRIGVRYDGSEPHNAPGWDNVEVEVKSFYPDDLKPPGAPRNLTIVR